MDRSRIVFSWLVFLSPGAGAQIIVPQSSIESLFSVGSRFELKADTTSDRPSVDVGSKGGPHIYDFTGLKLEAVHVDTLKSVAQFPVLASRFPGSGIVFTTPTDFEDYDLDAVDYIDGRLVTIGSYRRNDSSNTTIKNYSPPEMWFSFPITFGDSIRDNTEHTDSSFTDGAFSNVGTYLNPMDHVVDGYGTLSLPGGLNLDCLRIRKQEIAPYNYKGFWYVTNSGLILVVDSRNTAADEGEVENNGIFVVTGQSSVSVVSAEETPEGFSLAQNYPNPFNPVTRIQFSLGSAENVTLRVYDLLGRMVATILSERRSAGTHNVEWSASGVGSGVYVITIEAGAFRQSRRMVLVR